MTPAQWREGLFLKIVNVAAYLLFLGSSIYAAISPLDMYGNIKQTYFTPAIWAFFAWPIIHLFLLGTIIYQFTSADAKALVVDGISWGFPLLTTSYAIFVVVWAHHEHALAFVFALFLCYISCNIDLTLKKEHLPKSMGDEFLVHLPFSMWYAWTVVVVFLTAFETFGVDAGKDRNGTWTNSLIFLVLWVQAPEICALHGSHPFQLPLGVLRCRLGVFPYHGRPPCRFCYFVDIVGYLRSSTFLCVRPNLLPLTRKL